MKPKELHDTVWESKQKLVLELADSIKCDLGLIETVESLKLKGMKVAVASNSIKITLVKILRQLGIFDLFDFVLSNEDVDCPKPHPEIYLKCMEKAGVFASETVIFEDSPVGRCAAIRSGAKLVGVRDKHQLTKEFVLNAVDRNDCWSASDLNVLIPMAGLGSRFVKEGYELPKPLIDVCGKPMIQRVIESLRIDANYIFLCLKEHCDKYDLKSKLKDIVRCRVVVVDSVTDGAACTTLLARDLIDNHFPLLLANSDQYIEWDVAKTMYLFERAYFDGGILTFEDNDPKWSYVRIENNFVKEVAEKRVISNQATVGVYYWKHGSDYCKYADRMIQANKRVNNEFYVCPVFNEAIADGKKIVAHNVNRMCGLGTPEDLRKYEQSSNCCQISRGC